MLTIPGFNRQKIYQEVICSELLLVKRISDDDIGIDAANDNVDTVSLMVGVHCTQCSHFSLQINTRAHFQSVLASFIKVFLGVKIQQFLNKSL